MFMVRVQVQPRPVASVEFSICGHGNAVGLISGLDQGQFLLVDVCFGSVSCHIL